MTAASMRTYVPFIASEKHRQRLTRAYLGFGPMGLPDDTDDQMEKMMAMGDVVTQEPRETVQQAPETVGPPSGVIGGEDATPAETVADDIPMDVPEGSFIVNAAAAEVAGYKDIKKMIMDAVGVARRLGVDISTGNDKIGDEEAVDLLVSKGEVYIEPTLAKIIGYDVLEKINNRGKREVARRQEEAEQQQQAPMQEGGFVKKKFASGDKVTVYRGEPLVKTPGFLETMEPLDIDKDVQGKWYTKDINRAKGYGNVIRKMEVTVDELLDGFERAASYHGERAEMFGRGQKEMYTQKAKDFINKVSEELRDGKRTVQEIAALTEGIFPEAKDRAKVALVETFKQSPASAAALVTGGIMKQAAKLAGPVGAVMAVGEYLAGSGLNKGEEEMLKELTADDVQPQTDSSGFVPKN